MPFNRKAVSPLIATVILIGMTVALSTLIGGWVSQMARDRSDQITNQSETQLQCSYGDVYIEDVTYDCSANNLSLVVRNTGGIALVFSNIYVTNGTGNNVSVIAYSIFGGEKNLSTGDRVTWNTSSAATGINNTIVKVFVTSTNCPASRDNYPMQSSDYTNC